MKIKIEIDVPEYEGGTYCDDCPFCTTEDCCVPMSKYCDNVDYSRMQVKELEEDQ